MQDGLKGLWSQKWHSETTAASSVHLCSSPPPPESEVHPIVGEDPDDSGKLSRLGVRVENDPAIDVKGRQAGIGKDSSEKVRS